MDKIDSSLIELSTWINIYLGYKVTIKNMERQNLMSKAAFEDSTLKLNIKIHYLKKKREQIQEGLTLIEEA